MDNPLSSTSWSKALRGMRGISFQLAVLLSLAVLPIGIISVVQSLGFVRESRAQAETLLLALTHEGATLEHRLIETGLHPDAGLTNAVIKTRATPTECAREVSRFIADQSIFRSVWFTALDGTSLCSSDGRDRTIARVVADQMFRVAPKVTVDRIGPESPGLPSLLQITQPLYENGQLIGTLSMAAPSLQLLHLPGNSGVPVPTEVVVFNAGGTILGSTLDMTDVANRLPPPSQVDTLLQGPDSFVDATDVAGQPRSFVKVTLIKDTVLAIGIWPTDNPISQANGVLANALTFPLLMWVVSLTSALLAARRLVIRPIQMLRDEMRRFALGQRNDPMDLPAGAAMEIQEAIGTFNKLELIVTRNESVLAVTASGKLLLLREVHHRIKNNLQMISSIISIQRRKTQRDDVKLVLRSLQDRVMSIAAVDQSLYQNGDVWDVRADVLIASITERLIGVKLEAGHAVKVTSHFDPVVLHADQIGPLSLLANEAMTNALKYGRKPAQRPAFVDVQLRWDQDLIHFVISNSVGPEPAGTEPEPDSTGLGMTLIQAFCEQLGATCVSGLDVAEHCFTLAVTFKPSGLTRERPDPLTEDEPEPALQVDPSWPSQDQPDQATSRSGAPLNNGPA